MLRIILTCGVLVLWNGIYVSSTGDNMLGEGLWDVIHVEPSTDKDYQISAEILMKRLNRTHNGFDCKFYLPMDLDNTCIVTLNISICVDGGCKPYQMITQKMDDMIEKYAEGNFKTAMSMAGLEPVMPIPAGNHTLEGYPLNYCEMPKKCVFGKFDVIACVEKDNEKIFCAKVMVDFKDAEGAECEE